MKETVFIILLTLQLAAISFLLILQLKTMDFMFQMKLMPEKIVIATLDRQGVEEIIKGEQ